MGLRWYYTKKHRGSRQRPSIRPISLNHPKSVASRAVLRDLGHIEGRGRLLKCFLVLLSDECTQIICFKFIFSEKQGNLLYQGYD